MEQLRCIRKERGLSQMKLAAKAGVDQATVNQIERGARKPSTATLEKLALALDVEMADFFRGYEVPKAQAPLPFDELQAERREAEQPDQLLAKLLDSLTEEARRLRQDIVAAPTAFPVKAAGDYALRYMQLMAMYKGLEREELVTPPAREARVRFDGAHELLRPWLDEWKRKDAADEADNDASDEGATA